MTSTLADTFLDDLDDLNDSDQEIGITNNNNDDKDGDDDDDDDDDDDGIEMDDENFDAKLVNLVVAKVANNVGNLRKSSIYINILSKVKSELEANNNIAKIGNLEDDADYKLILTCNKMIADIDSEIQSTHQYVVDIYSSKFPELEGLIPNKLEFINTVKRIGNEMDMTMVELGDILANSTVMIVSVTGSITSGKPLSEKQLAEVQNGCEEVLKLYDDKTIILKYVENRMNKISPNLCNLIGSRVAAQMVGIAGGLISLSKIPSCNIQILGQEKLNGNGLSNIGVQKHTGALFMCELVQKCPPNMRRKALKVVAGKVSLVARIDSYNNNPDGIEGINMKADIQSKFEKWQEAPHARTKKALPIPEEKKKSKRGGKRISKMKERNKVTEIAQQQNKMNVSVTDGEYGDSAMGRSVGIVGAKDTGRIRVTQNKASSFNNKHQKKAVNANLGLTNGLSSSMVFTPIQGLELKRGGVSAVQKVEDANKAWFNSSSGFLSAAPKR